MDFKLIIGLILLILGMMLLLAGVLAISVRNADEDENRHPIFSIMLVVTSLAILFDFINNLTKSSASWREMKVEIFLLSIGIVMSLTGAIICLF